MAEYHADVLTMSVTVRYAKQLGDLIVVLADKIALFPIPYNSVNSLFTA